MLRAEEVVDRTARVSPLVSTVVRLAGLTDDAVTDDVEVVQKLSGSMILRTNVAMVAVISATISATENRVFDIRVGELGAGAAPAMLDGKLKEALHSADGH